MPSFRTDDDDRRRVRFLKQGNSPGVDAPVKFPGSSPGAQQTAIETRPARPSSIRIAGNIVDLAKEDDPEALQAIFGQFIPADENVVWCGYLGKLGWYFGRHSFACLTDKRVADVSIGWFGEIIYQDALLEYFNSTVVVQPSRLMLYILCVFAAAMFGIGSISLFASLKEASASTLVYVVAVPVLLVLLFIAFEVVVRFYYLVSKCGIVLWIKDGVSIYIFTDRKLLTKANSLIRMLRFQRDERIAALGHIG